MAPTLTGGLGPGSRTGHCVAAIGNRIFSVGGYDGTQWLSDTHVLVTHATVGEKRSVTAEWLYSTPSGDVPRPHAGAASCLIGSKMFIFGGRSASGKYLADLHALDTVSNTWIKASFDGRNAPSARAGHTITNIGNRLFLHGGYDGTKRYNDSWIFDPREGTWYVAPIHGISPLSIPPRSLHTTTDIGSKLFIYGGFDGKKDLSAPLWCDTSHWKWSHAFFHDMELPARSWHATIRCGTNFLVHGGHESSHGHVDSTLLVDGEGGTWQRLEAERVDVVSSSFLGSAPTSAASLASRHGSLHKAMSGGPMTPTSPRGTPNAAASQRNSFSLSAAAFTTTLSPSDAALPLQSSAHAMAAVPAAALGRDDVFAVVLGGWNGKKYHGTPRCLQLTGTMVSY